MTELTPITVYVPTADRTAQTYLPDYFERVVMDDELRKRVLSEERLSAKSFYTSMRVVDNDEFDRMFPDG